MKQIKTLLVLFFLLGINLTAQQKEDYTKYPGYFNYKEIAGLKNAESLSEVYLEETLLKMVAEMAEDKSDDVGDIVGGLKLVQVNEYRIGLKSIENMEASLNDIDKGTQAKGWDRIVHTNSRGNMTNIYIMKSSGGEFAGLTILSLSKREESAKSDNTEPSGKLTCVNIVGKIDLSKIGKLTKQFNLPGMEKMTKKEKEKE